MENSSQHAATERKPIIGIVIYPFAALIDFAGPHAALRMFRDTHILWKNLDPVPMDSGFSVVPTTTFAECPETLDVLLVPGGFGSEAAMEDREILDFLRDRGSRAHYVMSVCSAAPLLKAAGLLDGCKASAAELSYATADADELSAADANRFAGGGVPGGLGFGSTLLAALRGDEIAKTNPFSIEHDPASRFVSEHTGSAHESLRCRGHHVARR